MTAFEVVFEQAFSTLSFALMFVAACGVSLFAARQGDRAENLAGAALAYRFLMTWVIGLGPELTRQDVQLQTAQMVWLDLGVSLFLVFVALRHRRWPIVVIAALFLASAFHALRPPETPAADFVPLARALLASSMTVLAAATVRAMRRRARFGYPLAPARPLKPLMLRTLRDLITVRGRLDRRGYASRMFGLNFGFAAFVAAVGLSAVPLIYVAPEIERLGWTRPVVGALAMALIPMYALCALAFWSFAALAIRRWRDIHPRATLMFFAVLAAGSVEIAASERLFGREFNAVGYATAAALLLWPGRRSDAEVETQRLAGVFGDTARAGHRLIHVPVGPAIG